jgi:hypothetical protein
MSQPKRPVPDSTGAPRRMHFCKGIGGSRSADTEKRSGMIWASEVKLLKSEVFMAGCLAMGVGWTQEEERTSFLKKRSKKLLSLGTT